MTIELPAGSHVHGDAADGATSAATAGSATAGSRPALGDIRLDQAGTLNLKTGAGDVTVDRVAGHAEVTTGSGDVRIGEIDGSAVVKNSNGDTWIGAVGGDLRVNAANGDIAVDRGARRRRRQDRQRRRPARRGRRAARSCSRPRSATSRSASARAPPPGSTCSAALGQVHNALEAADGARARRPRPSRSAPAPPRRHHDPPLLTTISPRRRTMTTPSRSAIAATGLRKSFGDQVVLDGIDLDVAEGTIFALLGPNGAGKTTIVQILSTLIGADGGEVRVAGHDLAREPDAVRAAIGVTGQFSAVDNLLTGEENLILMADLHHLGRAEGRRRAAELLEQFDLAEAAEQAGRRPTPAACGAGSTWR